jgi:hypothetical protein
VLVIEIVKANYFDSGPTFVVEELLEGDQLKINKETLRGWMIESGLRVWKP